MVHGALCVMTVGTSMMPMWFVGSLVTAVPHLHVEKPTLVKAVVQSTMMKWPALGPSRVCLTVTIMVLEFMTAVIVKMQEWCALAQQVSSVLWGAQPCADII